jgi:hypothetical protein
MKCKNTRLIKVALICFAVVLSMSTFAQNTPHPHARKSAIPILAETVWSVYESDEKANSYFYFMPDGTLQTHFPYGVVGVHEVGIWKQDGNAIYINMNNKFAEYHGLIEEDFMGGKAANVNGHTWNWHAYKLSQAVVQKLPEPSGGWPKPVK